MEVFKIYFKLNLVLGNFFLIIYHFSLKIVLLSYTVHTVGFLMALCIWKEAIVAEMITYWQDNSSLSEKFVNINHRKLKNSICDGYKELCCLVIPRLAI
jgi:hypothetical protein